MLNSLYEPLGNGFSTFLGILFGVAIVALLGSFFWIFASKNSWSNEPLNPFWVKMSATPLVICLIAFLAFSIPALHHNNAIVSDAINKKERAAEVKRINDEHAAAFEVLRSTQEDYYKENGRYAKDLKTLQETFPAFNEYIKAQNKLKHDGGVAADGSESYNRSAYCYTEFLFDTNGKSLAATAMRLGCDDNWVETRLLTHE